LNTHAVANAVRERRLRALIGSALALVVLAALVHTRADPDLWGHVAFGRDTVNARSIDATDQYSFTSDKPWINHEWLAEAAMYAAYALLGNTGLIALKVAAVLVALLFTDRTLRLQGLGFRPRSLLVALVALAGIQQANAIRPQIFSIPLFAATLWVIVRAEHGRLGALAWIPPLLIVWVNLHGGWIVGAGTFGLWAAVEFARAPRDRRAALSLATVVAGLLGTLVNPYGWRMWAFLLSTVGLARPEISDWQPIYRMGPGIYLTWALLAALTAATLWRTRAPAARTIICLALAAGAFKVNRLLVFMTLAVVMLLGPHIETAFPRRRQRVPRPSGSRAQLGAASIAFVIAAAALLAIGRYGRCVLVENEGWPEPEAARFIGTHAANGRMLTWFDWGEYVVWQFGPGLQVSIDGRRETVYSPGVITEHLRMYYDGRNARGFLARHDVDYAWLPAGLPLVGRLESEGVPVVWRGPRSVLFATHATAGSPVATPRQPDPPTLSRCFPGP
jgi:hypothetical protein